MEKAKFGGGSDSRGMVIVVTKGSSMVIDVRW